MHLKCENTGRRNVLEIAYSDWRYYALKCVPSVCSQRLIVCSRHPETSVDVTMDSDNRLSRAVILVLEINRESLHLGTHNLP